MNEFLIALYRIYYYTRRLIKPMDTEQVFNEIYKTNLWGSKESVSGPGSTLAETKNIRKEIPKLIKDIRAKSMLDIPCGDQHWIKHTKIKIRYTGADIVNVLGDIQMNIIEDKLPKVDLILCRDCLNHFSNKDILCTIKNIKKSGSKYLLVTNFSECEKNRDIITGDWRAINLEKEPFNLPKPLKIIEEKFSDPKYADKNLGLWRIKDL